MTSHIIHEYVIMNHELRIEKTTHTTETYIRQRINELAYEYDFLAANRRRRREIAKEIAQHWLTLQSL